MEVTAKTCPPALVGLAVALVSLPGIALAQPPLRDSASAVGHVLQTDFFGSSEAGPNGEDPMGSLAQRLPGLHHPDDVPEHLR
jgi:hypothetical protein